MIKTLDFGDKKVNFNTAFAWTFAYKAQFHQDPAKVLIPVVKKINDINDEESEDDTKEAEDLGMMLYEDLGFTGLAEIAWSMAKIADKDIPEPVTWVASYGDDFPMSDIVSDLIPEAVLSCFSSKKSSAPIPPETQKKAPMTVK